jgi:hypothetical protein
MRKFSAEEQVAALLKSLTLETQFAVNDLKKDIALFVLIVWVAVARKLVRESKRRSLTLNNASEMTQAILATKFRRYEKRLAAAIEGILLARKMDFESGMLQITGDVKYTKTRKVSVDRLDFMALTLNQMLMLSLQTFQQRLVLRLRTDLLRPEDRALSTVLGVSYDEAEDLYDRLGGEFPYDKVSAKVADTAQSILPKLGPVPRLASEISQVVGDFAYTGLVDLTSPLFASSSSVSAIAAIVILDDVTGDFCQSIYKGVWDAKTGKALPISRVAVDFPGLPPYHRNCRTTATPLFHEGLVTSG